MDDPTDSPLDDTHSSDSISSASHSPTRPSPLPPSTTTDEVTAQNEVAAIDTEAERDTTTAPFDNNQADGNATAEKGDSVSPNPSTPSPHTSTSVESFEQQSELTSATQSDAEERPEEPDGNEGNTALNTEQASADSGSTEQTIAVVAAEQLSDLSTSDSSQIDNTATDRTTANDSTVDNATDTSVQPGEQPAEVVQQPTSSRSSASVAGSVEHETSTELVTASLASNQTTTLPPRSALHTAVPAVLTTFLTATDDLSNPPTADDSTDDPILELDTTADSAVHAITAAAADSTLPTSYPPSALIPSLSTSALESLLNFRSSASSLSALSSSSPLTSALRALKHVLDHPLLPPARPDDRRGYQFETLSRPRRVDGGEVRRKSSRYDEMGSKVSEHDRLHRRLQEELAVIQQESSALAAHYPLDPLNAAMLQADSDVNRVRLPRKERLDYMSAEHSRAINRVQRDRKKVKEEEAMSDLLSAVNSPPPSHILPPLTASAQRSRQPSTASSTAMQLAVIDTSDWS